MGWRTLAEWKKVIQDIPDDQYRWMEWHANTFAGLVLVPPGRLEAQFQECREIVQKHAPTARENPEAYREFVEECLADAFEVSVAVISRRLRKGGSELS
jgi:Zn-dependent peptidase ImmA (M78 family)